MIKGILKLKSKYKNKEMSNGIVPKFNTNTITDNNIEFYFNRGFDFIFTYVCKKCKDKACTCNKSK